MSDHPWKLYIYDKSSDIDRDQADGRFGDVMNLLTFGVATPASSTSAVILSAC
jgi:hypothetical protein